MIRTCYRTSVRKIRFLNIFVCTHNIICCQWVLDACATKQFHTLIFWASFSPFCFLIFQESDYFTPQGEFRVDKAGSPTLLNCLMYKMSYYRFGEMQVSTEKYKLKTVFIPWPSNITKTSTSLHAFDHFIHFSVRYSKVSTREKLCSEPWEIF